MNNIEKLAIEHSTVIREGNTSSFHAFVGGGNLYVMKANELEAFAKACALQSSEPVAGLELAAKHLDQKASDYEREHGYDDMGGLSFGSDIKMDYYNNLLELAEEIRALPTPTLPPSTVPLEEHNKRIAELEAQLAMYKESNENWMDGFKAMQATNKTLLDALKVGKGALSNARFLFLKYLPNHNWLSGFDKDFLALKQAIADAEGK